MHSKSQVKSSVQRAIKRAIVEQYPALEGKIDEILPKKEQFSIAKWCAVAGAWVLRCPPSVAALTACWGPPRSTDRSQLVVSSGQVKFFSQQDGTFFPALRVLHQCAWRPRAGAPGRPRGRRGATSACLGKGARDRARVAPERAHALRRGQTRT